MPEPKGMRGWKALGWAAIGVAVLFDGVNIKYAWNWFIAPPLNLAYISILSGIGFRLFLVVVYDNTTGANTLKSPENDDEYKELMISAGLKSVSVPIMTIFFLYPAHQIINFLKDFSWLSTP
jgi:hypothetical protein